jgi:hypothetical protein
MTAAASDRVSTPAITWSFGDGTGASGAAVSHAYAASGAYTVTITATDAAANSASESRSILIARAPRPRIVSPVTAKWGFSRRHIYLLRLRVTAPPTGAKAQLLCSGRGCPFKRTSSSRIRNNAITLFKALRLGRAAATRQRRFNPGQRLELRITAPGNIGKVVRYRLRRGKAPITDTLCLPLGAAKPQNMC